MASRNKNMIAPWTEAIRERKVPSDESLELCYQVQAQIKIPQIKLSYKGCNQESESGYQPGFRDIKGKTWEWKKRREKMIT